ncbi:RICIN domain-containing protein [Agromyces sp. SYSU T0242]|uniref:RICIN domain-containing protein n=1 Tax=Agromyces litoreus TaxID=3158561 RepID=UPI0033994090
MSSKTTKRIRMGAVAAVASALMIAPVSAQAYTPIPDVLYRLPGDADCLKGLGNCAIYPKSTQLPSGRIVASFERSIVPTSGSADGQTLPIYVSDDHGDSWQHVTEVEAPAYMSSDPAYDPYISNWTNPNLYVLPEPVGNLAAGTLLLASVVSGDDHYYLEHKAADPNWVPTNDGDRSDIAIALYSSTDEGATWEFQNIIAKGGWQGGSAGATGTNIANANQYAQIDPVWEPHLMARGGELIAYYSDENDYLAMNTSTGVPTVDPDNATAPDSGAQILAHRTWDGTGAAWSGPIVDVSGDTFAWNGGQQIGGGRPGMAYVAPTTDDKWMLTFEYFGGGANVRFKMVDDPLAFYADGDPNGREISLANGQQGDLPFAPGSRGLSWGGSPVVKALPDGRLVYNAAGSGDIWVNTSGSSTGAWTQFQTTMPSGYSRNLQYDEATGLVVILQAAWEGATTPSTVRFGHVDLGHAAAQYSSVVNRASGQVIGTGGNITDANIGNGDAPDVRLETFGAASVADTQYWRVVTKPDGAATLVNKSGGRSAAIWGGNAYAGASIGQWVDDAASGLWNIVPTSGGYVRFQSTANSSLYLTGGSNGAPVALAGYVDDGTQEWKLYAEGVTPPADTTAPVVSASVAGRTLTLAATDDATGVSSIQYRTVGATNWSTYSAPVKFNGRKSVDVEYRATDGAGNVSAVGTITIP